MLSSGKGGGGVAGDQLRPERPSRDGDRGDDKGISVLQSSLGPAVCSSSSSSSLLPPRLVGSRLGTELKNLELLHHFTTATYATLSTDDGIRELWRMTVPRIAFSYGYVMHALLAMSARHLSFLKPSDKSYEVVAAGHYDKALSLLRAAFPALDPDQATALFAASSLVAIHVYACPPAVENTLLKAPSWIPMMRGIWAVPQCREWVKKGELGQILGKKPVDNSRYAGEDIVFPSSLSAMLQRGAPGQLDPEELEDDEVLGIYRNALQALKESWDRSWLTEYRMAEAFFWPVHMVQGKFLDFLEERRPRALVLLAHHCALMESVDDQYWWVKGRGVDEIARIDGILEEKWKPWLDWPKRRSIPKAMKHVE